MGLCLSIDALQKQGAGWPVLSLPDWEHAALRPLPTACVLMHHGHRKVQ